MSEPTLDERCEQCGWCLPAHHDGCTEANKPTLDERIEGLRKRIEGIAGYDSDPLGQEAIEALAIIDELQEWKRKYIEVAEDNKEAFAIIIDELRKVSELKAELKAENAKIRESRQLAADLLSQRVSRIAELEAENERLKAKIERVSTCLENDAFQMAKEWLEGER